MNLTVESPVAKVIFNPQFPAPIAATGTKMQLGVLITPPGSHVNLSVDFGDGSVPQALTTRFDPRILTEFAFPAHTYSRPGMYWLRIKAWNHVSSWEGVLLPPARALNPPRGLSTVSAVYRVQPMELVTMTARLEAGTNVTIRWNFGDGIVRETASKIFFTLFPNKKYS